MMLFRNPFHGTKSCFGLYDAGSGSVVPGNFVTRGKRSLLNASETVALFGKIWARDEAKTLALAAAA